ncbi:MAG: hypothetical protein MZU84_05335 [Sphingobacterium sp.]|nr:hypothetical protein [Sphingobacterium sp.]
MMPGNAGAPWPGACWRDRRIPRRDRRPGVPAVPQTRPPRPLPRRYHRQRRCPIGSAAAGTWSR